MQMDGGTQSRQKNKIVKKSGENLKDCLYLAYVMSAYILWIFNPKKTTID
jgi:hypothetical protein